MNPDDLIQTLTAALRSGTAPNAAFETLVRDYANFHLVVVIVESVLGSLLIAFTIFCWSRYSAARRSTTHTQAFARTVFGGFGLTGAALSLLMLLHVAINLSVLDRRVGFAGAIPEFVAPRRGTENAALYHAVNSWVLSGSPEIPSLLADRVARRLAWQAPKAIVSSILFVTLVGLTGFTWRSLLRSRATGAAWDLKEKLLLGIGVLGVPVTVLLMMMAIANTQASLAPMFLALLFA